MAFISSCPKCQKQVLVPDGTCPDAVVQCPRLLGRILDGRDFRVGAAGADCRSSGQRRGSLSGGCGSRAAASASAMSEGRVFSAHRVEPKMHDDEPLLFQGDEVQLATPDYGHAAAVGHEAAEHVAEAVLFEASPAAAQEGVQKTDHPVESLAEPFGEPLAAPLSEEGHDLAAEPADGGAPWGGAWGGFKDEAAHEEDGAVGLAEPDQDEGLEHVDFAAITGKAAPGSAPAAGPGDAAVAAEPAKKKKRKREANPFVRIIGVIVCRPLGLSLRVWNRGLAVAKNGLPPHLAPLLKNNKPARQYGQSPLPIQIRRRPMPLRQALMQASPTRFPAPKPASLAPAAGKQPGEDQGGTTAVSQNPGRRQQARDPRCGQGNRGGYEHACQGRDEARSPFHGQSPGDPEPFGGTSTDTKPELRPLPNRKRPPSPRPNRSVPPAVLP